MMKKVLVIFQKIVIITLFLTLGLSLGSLLFEKYIFYAHVLVHFQLQYWVIITLCVLILFSRKSFVYATIGMLYTITFYVIWIHAVTLRSIPPSSVDVIFLNSQYDNAQTQPVLDLVHQFNPTTIALVESNPDLVDSLTETYDEPLVNHRAYASSCTILSSSPPTQSEVRGKDYLPLCVVNFADFDLITVHPHRPLTKAILDENIQFFDSIQRVITEHEVRGRHFLIVGDFNATHYSAYFRERFARYDQSILYTWMVGTPLVLPLDHVLTDMNIRVGRSKSVGSDHTALLIDILD